VGEHIHTVTIGIRRTQELYEIELRHDDPGNQAEHEPRRGTAAFDLEGLSSLLERPDDYGTALAVQLFSAREIVEGFVAAESVASTPGGFLRLQLRIERSAQELQKLRWELLRHPRSGAVLSTSERVMLSRFMLSLDPQPVVPPERAKPRVLVAVAAPNTESLVRMKLGPVDYAGEVERARKALGGLEMRILGGPGCPVTLDCLVAELRRGVDIVYLVCHGRLGREGTPGLALEDDAGDVVWIEGEALAIRMGELQERPRLMVLASCQGAGDGEHPSTASSAPGSTAQATAASLLAEAGVPAVIAMQGLITMKSIEIMIPTLFSELLVHGEIDRALAVARGRIRKHHDWWMPVLFTRLKGGVLWSKPGQHRDVRASPKVASTRLPHKATELFGREEELRQLDAEWASSGAEKRNVAVIVAWGGVGKTSLVFAWMNRLAADGYRGATAVFDWSFYSQGVRERGAASGDQFLREALRFFGDEAMADSAASAWDKGARLAELVGRQRALLVLDGLEPLQQPPGRGVAAGKLTDPAIAALLRGVARTNAGLCVVTTRETVEDLEGFGKAVSQRKLERLSEKAGVELLRSLLGEARVSKAEVASTKLELAAIWKAVDGHALTLSLLGRYLRRRRWDVRRWREIRFEDADGKVQGGHAFRMLGAYERWLAGEDGEAMPGGQRMLAVLRILGLFDRAADPGCIGAICEGEAIEGLTEPLVGLDEGDWAEVLADLEALGLVSREAWEPVRIEGYPRDQTDLDTGKTTGTPEVKVMPGWSRLKDSLDAHPLVREYFGRRVRQTSEAAWKEGHRRVFEYLCESTPYWPEGTYGLGPLYQAVAHGCQAGEVQKARDEVYRDRILRGTSHGGFYSGKKLGLVGADLGVLAWFFELPWSRPSPSLAKNAQAWLLNEAAIRLRTLGRLAEAVEPMRAGLERRVEHEHWMQAARVANNLSELELTRGEVTEALRIAEQSVSFADRSADAFMQMVNRTTHADALHQAGRRDEARRQFEEAEAMQTEQQPSYPRLYSVQGFQYGDLLLFEAEHAAWREMLARGNGLALGASWAAYFGDARSSTSNDAMVHGRALVTCNEVLERATQMLEWSQQHRVSLLDVALQYLSLGRVSLYRALLADPAPNLASGPAYPRQRRPASPANLATAKQHLGAAVEGLRSSGHADYLPWGLLTRAWLHHLLDNPTAALADLDEVESLATRCGMPIFLADAHLTRARLFRDRTELAKARKLLFDLRARGYHRHNEMLADAEEASKGWPEPA